MRLIDADKLEKDANDDLLNCPDTTEEVYWNDGAKSIIDLIKTAPTIDPVKHGKWIHDDFGWHCSRCHSLLYAPNNIPTDYCGWCGAKMVEVDEDEID